MSIEIFPHSLVRYAGMNHQVFDSFKLEESNGILQKHQRMDRAKSKLKTLICDALFDLISAQTDDELRQQLINLKRQVFNDKTISQQKITAIQHLFSASLAIDFQDYIKLIQQIDTFQTANTTNFNFMLLEQRRKILVLATDQALQNGLLLSSPVLLEQLPEYLKKEPASFRQKELRIEFSLLRYLTRMCFKTSPFSTFTYTGIMQLKANSAAFSALSEKVVKNSLRLNNALFEYLKSILIHHPVMNELLIIKLNKTVVIQGDKMQFLVNFNNIEAFQQLPASGLQLLIFHYLKNSCHSVSVKTLADNLSDAVEEADFSTIKRYLLKLAAAGLLELGMETSGIDPHWDTKLLKFFTDQDSNEPAVSQIIYLFKQLKQYQSAYLLGDTAKRKLILTYAENTVADVFKKLQTEAGLPAGVVKAEETKVSGAPGIFETTNFTPYHFSGRQLFYEDCYTPDLEVLEATPVNKFAEKADQLLNHLIPLDLLKNEKEKMSRFFLEYYPVTARVKAIDFYQSYYFHIKKPEKENAANKISLAVEPGDWEKKVSQKLAGLIAHRPAVLNLENDFFADLTPLDQPVSKNQYSRGLFVQFYQGGDHGSLFGVINSVLPGMGKVSGRFLPLFTPAITADFVHYNNRLYPEILKAELNDASSFNANIHPPLLGLELALPGGNKSYTEEKQIPVKELSVSYDPESGSLKLSDQHQEIFTYDLCLESFYNRSNLYQLLTHFNPDVKLSLQPFINLVDGCYVASEEEQEHEIESLPRITYRETVVLRRRTWRVKTTFIPVQQSSETAYAYFIRLNAWRCQHGISASVFLFLRKRSFFIKQKIQTKDKKDGFADDYKPQFIAFEQPLLIEMFKRLLTRAGDYLIFEEVLPVIGSDASGQRGPVKEYLLQWYKY